MEKTLINRNQFQYFGITICDEPTDQHRPLGIVVDFNAHTPISMMGSTCGYITLYTIDGKIEIYRHITVSDEHDWDPSKHIFKISLVEKELRRNVLNLGSMNQVRIQTLYAPPVTHMYKYIKYVRSYIDCPSSR